MKELALSDELSLPVDAATQTFAFIARKGAGKTYAAGKLNELLLDAGVQCVILDTVGNWYGLRIAADGKGKGFDIPVLGGLRGDIPLEATGGELVADLVVESGRSVILDLSQFSQADRKRFATAFAVEVQVISPQVAKRIPARTPSCRLVSGLRCAKATIIRRMPLELVEGRGELRASREFFE